MLEAAPTAFVLISNPPAILLYVTTADNAALAVLIADCIFNAASEKLAASVKSIAVSSNASPLILIFNAPSDTNFNASNVPLYSAPRMYADTLVFILRAKRMLVGFLKLFT